MGSIHEKECHGTTPFSSIKKNASTVERQAFRQDGLRDWVGCIWAGLHYTDTPIWVSLCACTTPRTMGLLLEMGPIHRTHFAPYAAPPYWACTV